MPSSNRPLRALIAVFGVLFAVVAIAGPAHAAVSYADESTTTVSDETPAAGSSFTVSGSGYEPGETVTIALSGGATLGTAVADEDGNFSLSITLPDGVTGEQTIISTGESSGNTSSITLEVAGDTALVPTPTTPATPTTAGSGGVLAATGSALIGIGSLAGLLLVGGGFMLLASRIRRAHA